MKTVNWPEPEGKNKGYQFFFITHVPSSPVLELHITSQVEIRMHGGCTKQWEFLFRKPSPFGPFIFSFKLLLLNYVFSMENIDDRSFHQPNHREKGMPYKMRKLKSSC